MIGEARRENTPGKWLAACIAVLMLGASSAAAADTVVVTADRMVDTVAGRVVDRPQVTITDGRIVAVGHQGDAMPAGARRVDLPGETLLPGLIDMHVHLDADATINGLDRLRYTDNFFAVIGVPNAAKMLRAGFTTVRNVGSRDFNDVALKQAIERGDIPGPRIVPATYLIGATGGHCDETGDLPPSRTGRNSGWAAAPTRCAKSSAACANTARR